MIEQTLFSLGAEAAVDLALTGGLEVAVDQEFSAVRRIELDETSWVEHIPGWLRGDLDLMQLLLATEQWEQRSRWMYTRMVLEPRLTAERPRISAARQPVVPYLARVLSTHYGMHFTRLWMNWYRDNSDGTGWHADKLADPGLATIIPVLSLGATRKFLIRPVAGGPSTTIVVHGGDLVVMGGLCQKDYRHCVPKQKVFSGARVSLNFSGRAHETMDR